ncbi:hypothetical protein Bca4012_076474 [Brassica carinata]
MRKCSSLWIHEPFQERLLDPREASRIKLSLINKLALLWDPCNRPTDAEALYVPSFQVHQRVCASDTMAVTVPVLIS